MTYHYHLTPYGIICTKCGYRIKFDHSDRSEYRTIYEHEVKGKYHVVALSKKQLEEVLNDYHEQMKAIAMEVVLASIVSIHQARTVLMRYVVSPIRQWSFCSECKVVLYDLRMHKDFGHAQYCHGFRDGYAIPFWKSRNPLIVTEPIDIDNEAIFCSVYWRYYQKAKQLQLVDSEFDQSNVVMPLTTEESVFKSILDQKLHWRDYPENRDRIVQVLPQHVEPNLWMNRVAWNNHLKDYDLRAISKLSRPVTEEEIVLLNVVKSIDLTMKNAIDFAKSIDKSNPVLKIVYRIDDKQVTKPFNADLQKDTWEKYLSWLKKIIIVLFRVENGKEIQKPSYKLTANQEISFQEVLFASNGHSSFDQCTRFLLSLIDQEMQTAPYEFVFLSALAMISVDEYGQFFSAKNTTPIYAAVLAIYRTLVLAESHRLSLVTTNGSWINQLLLLCNKLLMHPDRHSSPGPISWILDTFAYAETVASDESGTPSIAWHDADTMLYNGTSVSMEKLRRMVHTLVDRGQGLLGHLLSVTSANRSSNIPRIHWENIHDDVNNRHEFGYSFLKDHRNEWLVNKENWLFNHVMKNDDLRKLWFNESTMRLVDGILAKYENNLHSFLSILLTLVHMTSGQPSRGTEILNIRYYNTQTKRNVFIYKQSVAIGTSYHKQLVQYDKEKVVHRFLPRSVGELMVHYLWLVVPFYTTMKGFTVNNYNISPYVWTTNILVTPTINSQGDFWGTSNHLSKFLKEYSSELLGFAINTYIWRHIAIAIARKFFRNIVTSSMINQNENDAWDTQANHTTRTAERIYAVEFDAATSPEQMEIYFNVSSTWFGFFFPAVGSLKSFKCSISEQYYDRRRIRLKRLMVTNVQRSLEQLLRNCLVEFRGNQQATIESIIRGDPIVLQVAGTGSGKSLSFMLPAFSCPEGTSIVIVPLVSLQMNLVDRCRSNRISACIWRSFDALNCLHSLVFVTPEAACCPAFFEYVNYLISNQLLDRIFIDECHYLLQCGVDFRRRLDEIKNVIKVAAVQMVLLTATLPLTMESILFSKLGIQHEQVTIHRDCTRRRNLRYIVEDIGNNDASLIPRIRKELGIAGKIIVYTRTIEIGKVISEALDCPFFYSGLGSHTDKENILQEFSTSCNLIVATNAFGLGIDIPNIRKVIHAGSPHSLLEFSQESGRAGRDGIGSVSLLLHQSKWQVDKEMNLYIKAVHCRREIMNEYMDGQRKSCCRTYELDLLCDRCSSTSAYDERTINETFLENDDDIDLESPLKNTDDGRYMAVMVTGTGKKSKEIAGVNVSETPKMPAIAKQQVETPNQFTGRLHATSTKPASTLPSISNKRSNPYQKASSATRSSFEENVNHTLNQESNRKKQYLEERQAGATLIRSIKIMMDDFRLVLLSQNKCFVCKLQGMESCIPNHFDIRRRVNANRESLIRRLKQDQLLPPYCACRNPGCYMPQVWCKYYDRSLPAASRQCLYRFVIADLMYTLREVSKKAEQHFIKTLSDSGIRDEAKFLSQEWRIDPDFRSINILFMTFQMYQIHINDKK